MVHLGQALAEAADAQVPFQVTPRARVLLTLSLLRLDGRATPLQNGGLGPLLAPNYLKSHNKLASRSHQDRQKRCDFWRS